MKNKLVIFFAIIGCAVTLNSCFLFGGGKSKCGDCPTWSQNTEEVEQDWIVESENV